MMKCDTSRRKKLIHGLLVSSSSLGWMIRQKRVFVILLTIVLLFFSSNNTTKASSSSTPSSSSSWWSRRSNISKNKNKNDYKNNDEDLNDYSVPEISITDDSNPPPQPPYYENEDNTEKWQQQQQRRPPPPPPPPPPGYAPPPPLPLSSDSSSSLSSSFAQQAQESKYNPIHYQFQAKSTTASSASASPQLDSSVVVDDNDGIPQTYRPGDNDNENSILYSKSDLDRKQGRRSRGRRMNTDDMGSASPRQDAITLFMSRGGIRARFLLHCSSGTVGVLIGLFLIKSLFSSSTSISSTTILLWFMTFFIISIMCRNDYGEWIRALGLTLLWTLQRSYQMRRHHPVIPHMKAMLHLAPRKPFPPLDDQSSLWTYQPSDDEDDVDFSMWQCLVSMALIGSFCGGHVPLLPSWMGGLVGAGVFCAATTSYNANQADSSSSAAALGDLARTMGMRTSQLARISWQTSSQLNVLPKTATVATKILDKLLVLDRKHSIRDKIITILSWIYDQVRNTANQMQQSSQSSQSRGPPPPPDEYNNRQESTRRRRGPPPPPPRGGPPPRLQQQRRPRPPRGDPEEQQYSRRLPEDRYNNIDTDYDYYQEPPPPRP